MKYLVSIGVDGYVNMEIEADNASDALDVAVNKVCNMNFSMLEDIEFRTACVMDENRNEIDIIPKKF